jgi:predicted house-cleaning NTP pyrophosphatase (Maf/HAM1 superfamily)
VLAADTEVVLRGGPLGKPADAADAWAMLAALRGRRHRVLTGVAVARGRRVWVAHAATRVWMRSYSDDEVAATIASGTPFDKAGGYAIQDTEFRPVAAVDGCYCAVVGLPLATAIDLLRRADVDLPDSATRNLLPECGACPLFARTGLDKRGN